MSKSDILGDKDLLPIVPYVARDPQGNPHLYGSECGRCAAISLATPKVCPSCGARDGLMPIRLGETGKLYNYTVVHRSQPGVKVPFIFAIVDLEGGGTVKGNLVADESAVGFDMPVNLVFGKADAVDAKGRSYLSYHFVPA